MEQKKYRSLSETFHGVADRLWDFPRVDTSWLHGRFNRLRSLEETCGGAVGILSGALAFQDLWFPYALGVTLAGVWGGKVAGRTIYKYQDNLRL